MGLPGAWGYFTLYIGDITPFIIYNARGPLGAPPEVFRLSPLKVGFEGRAVRLQGGYILFYHGPPKPTFLEVFMVNNLVFRWPKPLFFMVLRAHGIYTFWGGIN